MTSTNIVFMIHMRNKYYEKLDKIESKKIKYDLDKQDKNKEELDEKEKNCKEIFKNYLNYLEKVSIKTFESMELQSI